MEAWRRIGSLRSPGALVAGFCAAAAGCAVEPGGPEPLREKSAQTRIDDLREPGSIISLGPERNDRIACPHCGAESRLGETFCSRCRKRLSTSPVWVPCPLCEARPGTPAAPRCPQCGGRGWVISAEETEAVAPSEEDRGVVPASPDGTPRDEG